MHFLSDLRLAASAVALAASAAGAQAPPSAPTASAQPLPYASVAEALKSLEAQDGNGFIVTHADGWTIVSEPVAAAQWSFTPSGYYAHPAVVRRTIRRGTDGAVAVEISSLCEAPKPACAQLVEEFEGFNERIRQSVKARQRTQPPTPAPAPR